MSDTEQQVIIADNEGEFHRKQSEATPRPGQPCPTCQCDGTIEGKYRDSLKQRVAELTRALRGTRTMPLQDGTFCWCNGKSVDQMTDSAVKHESQCLEARAAIKGESQ